MPPSNEWRQIYLDDFIPFAHGVRQLGIYYNDAVQPDDPYEFVGLLKGQRMVASRRNQALQALAEQVRADQGTPRSAVAGRRSGVAGCTCPGCRLSLAVTSFVQAFENLQSEFMDVTYGGERLSDRPDLLLQTILEMAKVAQACPVAGCGRRCGSGYGPGAGAAAFWKLSARSGVKRRWKCWPSAG